ncbi:MAG: OmpH family outer membrane protein [Verrucomicrobiia bacterium]|jgi:Skp family chaperone for outer membrane proteins
MKNITVTFVTAGIVALSTTAFPQVPSGRIVLVDLNRVFIEYYKTPIASAKLKETIESYNKEQEELRTQLRKGIDELTKLREEQEKTEYTPEVREQKKKAVQEKLSETQKAQRDLEEYQHSHQQILDQQRDRMRQTILGEIKDVVSKEAKDAGYTLVFDKSGNTLNGIPTVVYSQDSMDITDDIIKKLNKNQPKTTETPKPEQKKSETK